MNLNFNEQTVLSLLTSEEEFPVNLEEAVRWLEYSSKQKAKNKLVNNFELGLDYIIVNQSIEADNLNTFSPQELGVLSRKENIYLSVSCFKNLCLIVRTPQSLKIFSLLGNTLPPKVVLPSRLELEFKNILEGCISWKTKIIPQFAIKIQNTIFRLDFYLPEYQLAIEYYERGHSKTENYDMIRQSLIENYLGCHFIVVHEKKEKQALEQIMKYVFSK